MEEGLDFWLVGGDDGVLGGGVFENFDRGLEFGAVYGCYDEDVGGALVEGYLLALEESGE